MAITSKRLAPRLCAAQETNLSLRDMAKQAHGLGMRALRNYYLRKLGISLFELLNEELFSEINAEAINQ